MTSQQFRQDMVTDFSFNLLSTDDSNHHINELLVEKWLVSYSDKNTERFELLLESAVY